MSKEHFIKKLVVDREIYEETQRILDIEEFDEDFEGTNEMIFSKEAVFDDGTYVVIAVYTGQHNAWVEDAWYDKDHNFLAASEPDFTLGGSYYETDTAIYDAELICGN